MFNGIFCEEEWDTETENCIVRADYAYFGKDFESYLRTAIEDYTSMEQTISEKYHISSKPGKAKAIAQHIEEIPHFIKDIADKLLIIELLGQN